MGRLLYKSLYNSCIGFPQCSFIGSFNGIQTHTLFFSAGNRSDKQRHDIREGITYRSILGWMHGGLPRRTHSIRAGSSSKYRYFPCAARSADEFHFDLRDIDARHIDTTVFYFHEFCAGWKLEDCFRSVMIQPTAQYQYSDQNRYCCPPVGAKTIKQGFHSNLPKEKMT